MLSLHKVTDKDICLAQVFRDAEDKTPKAAIWYTPTYKGAPQIETDDIRNLLRYEQLTIMKQFGLTAQEYEHLVDVVREGHPIDPDTERGLKRAHLHMRVLVERKLKKEVSFSEDDEIYLRVLYDTHEAKTNYIVGVFGASGSGKSYSVCQLLLRDPALHTYERVVLLGSVGEDDPSYAPLKEEVFQRWTFKNTKDITQSDMAVRDYAHCALIFDDIDSEANPKLRKSIQLFRDRCLQTARHFSIRIINTAHLFNSYRETAKIRNSARWLFIFPRSIPHTLVQILEKTYNYKRAEALHLTNLCKRDGRLTVIHKNAPTFLMTPKRLILL
ncbi:MAG: hypothetical protein VX475_18565 [Myxococcota bacterium]|nr:hypothetical protein [Myxococcota bacterium]